MIAVTGVRSGLHWDMMRARNKGRIVYRHLSGLPSAQGAYGVVTTCAMIPPSFTSCVDTPFHSR